jgi:hypothetical protein
MDISVEKDLVPWVKDAGPLLHAIKPDARLVATGRYYRYLPPGMTAHGRHRTPISLNGITTVMRALMTWEVIGPVRTERARRIAPARRGRVGMSRPRPPTHRRPAAAAGAAAAPTAQEAVRGHVRGSLVHEQIMHMSFLSEEDFRRLHPQGVHPFVPAILRAYRAHGQYPVRAEFPVAEVAGRMATRLDTLTVRKSGHLTGVEVKTGFANGAFRAPQYALLDGNARPVPLPLRATTPRFRYRLKWHPALVAALRARAPEFGLGRGSVPLVDDADTIGAGEGVCTPANMAMAQASLGQMMAYRWLGLPTATIDAAVLRVDEAGYEWLPVARNVLALLDAVLYPDAMRASLQISDPDAAAAAAADEEEEDEASM